MHRFPYLLIVLGAATIARLLVGSSAALGISRLLVGLGATSRASWWTSLPPLVPTDQPRS